MEMKFRIPVYLKRPDCKKFLGFWVKSINGKASSFIKKTDQDLLSLSLASDKGELEDSVDNAELSTCMTLPNEDGVETEIFVNDIVYNDVAHWLVCFETGVMGAYRVERKDGAWKKVGDSSLCMALRAIKGAKYFSNIHE